MSTSTPRRGPRGGVSWRRLGVAFALVVLCSGGRAAAAGTPPLPIPLLPGLPIGDPVGFPDGVQPTVAAPPCSFAPLGTNEVRSIYSWRSPSGMTAGTPTIDPWIPCHLYRVFKSVTELAEVQRGDMVNGTVRWRQVFVDNAAAAPAPTAPPRPVPVGTSSNDLGAPDLVTVAAPGRPYFQVIGGVGGVRHSADAGEHWDHRDGGLISTGVQGQTGTTVRPSTSSPYPGAFLTFAATDPQVGLLFFSGDNQVHLTHDGGTSWSLVPLPTTEVAAVAIDPTDASRLIVVDQTPLTNVAGAVQPPAWVQVIWRSDDGGMHWWADATATLPGPVMQLVVTHPAGAPLQYFCALREAAGMQWFERADGAAAWRQLPVPVTPATAMAVDPTDPSTMVWVGGSGTTLRVEASSDGFASPARLRNTLTLSAGWGLQDLSLQADHRGDFFLYWRITGTTSTNPGLQSEAMIAFRPPALLGIVAPPASVPPLPPAAVPQVPSRIDRICPIPGAVKEFSGNLTFDGRYLDYTVDAGTGGDLLQGRGIERLDTACHPAPPLLLHGADFPGGSIPTLYELSYQPELVFPDGTPGAILAAGDRDTDPRLPSGDAPIYAINPVSGATTLLLGTQTSTSPLGGQGAARIRGVPLFSYDIFRNGLWTIGQGPDGVDDAGLLSWDGVLHTGCMTDFANPFTGFGSGDSSSLGVATWTVGGDGVMYVQTEDDTSTYRVDDRTCRVIDGFRHVNLGEPSDENEQLACDAITFGTAFAADAHSVLWIRNTVDNSAVAYQIPDGYCPFPTQLAYNGDTLAPVSAPVTLCATLRAETAGTREPLADEDVSFTVDGSPRGTGRSDGAGRACVHTVAPAAPGPHAVTGSFAGTRAYLPSHADAVLVTVGTPTVQQAHTLTPLLTPSTSGEPPTTSAPAAQAQPEPQAAAQMQVDAAAQTQAQAQSQSVAQLQPGMMTQPRSQRQVATQTVVRRHANAPALLASRQQPSWVALRRAETPGAALVMLMVAGVAPRPRRVGAWLRRGRSR